MFPCSNTWAPNDWITSSASHQDQHKFVKESFIWSRCAGARKYLKSAEQWDPRKLFDTKFARHQQIWGKMASWWYLAVSSQMLCVNNSKILQKGSRTHHQTISDTSYLASWTSYSHWESKPRRLSQANSRDSNHLITDVILNKTICQWRSYLLKAHFIIWFYMLESIVPLLLFLLMSCYCSRK